jgi:hypothetical protein
MFWAAFLGRHCRLLPKLRRLFRGPRRMLGKLN